MRWGTLIVSLTLITPSCQAAVAFLNRNTGVIQAGGTFSTSLTVNATGSNRIATAPVCWDGATGSSVSSITYGAQAMTAATLVSSNDNGTNMNCQWYYLANPPTGSNTLAITISGPPVEIYANIVSFTGADQSTPVRSGSTQNPTNATTTAGHYIMTVNSNANDVSVTTMMDGVGGTSSSQTQDTANTGGNLEHYSDHATTPGATVAHNWTTSATDIAIAGFSIQATGATASSSAGLSFSGNAGSISTKGTTGSISFK